MANFRNLQLGQVSHVILSRYILGGRGIPGEVRVNHANRTANLLIFIHNGGI